jgi:hypothetical protein
MLRFIQCAILLMTLNILTPVLAWGAIGHEVICEIAFQELTPAAREKVNALIERDNEFSLFAKSCSWPDRPRRRPKEHYVNLPRDAAGFVGRPCPVAEKCVVSAVLEDMSSLALATDEDDKLRALKGLSHWVGDLHQPMHVSFQDDRGANKVDVDAPCSSNLHAVWDTCIIEKAIGRDGRKIALELRGEISAEDRAKWLPANVDTISVIGWADESFQIAVKPETGYCVKKDGECWYAPELREYVPERPQKKAVVNHAYLAKHAPIVRERMKKAGVRLAAILNTVFADAVVSATEPLVTAATSDDIRRLTKRIESLEQAVRALTEDLSRRRLNGAQFQR